MFELLLLVEVMEDERVKKEAIKIIEMRLAMTVGMPNLI